MLIRIIFGLQSEMRLARRYVCTAIIFTSLFWLAIDLTAVMWNKNNDELSNDRRDGSSNALVRIDYFKRFYKNVLDPQPGSAGMMGAVVRNPDSEKQKEDQSLEDYGFNELASSKISLERSIPDNRDPR